MDCRGVQMDPKMHQHYCHNFRINPTLLFHLQSNLTSEQLCIAFYSIYDCCPYVFCIIDHIPKVIFDVGGFIEQFYRESLLNMKSQEKVPLCLILLLFKVFNIQNFIFIVHTISDFDFLHERIHILESKYMK